MQISKRFIGLTLTLSLTSVAHAQRPPFQMPVPCGQTWDASTYAGHWPDADSIDITQRDGGANIGEGEPVLASAAGTVLDVFTSPNGEHRVYLDHGNGWVSHYIHIEEEPPLAIGQEVAQGEQIARTSNSGADAVHIHYTQVQNGSAVRSQFNGTNISTHAGNLDSYGTWGTDDAEKITSLNCAGNSFMGWSQDGDRYFLIYKPGTGAAKIVRMDDDGTGATTTWSGTWTKGWTHFIPYYPEGSDHPHAIIYKSSTGQVSYNRLNLDGAGLTNLHNGTWYGGWTHLVPFTIDGEPYFVAYDSLHGYANIDRIDDDGNSVTNVYQSTWNKGRTSIVPFKLGSVQYLLLYRGGSGAVEIDKITGSGNGIGLTEVWSATWTSGWSHLVPVSHDGAVYLLGYKAADGTAKIMKLKAGGLGIETKSTMSWTTPWTAFSPYTIGGDGHVLIYKASTGEVKMLRLNGGGAGVTTIWQGVWTTGWT